MNEKGDLVPGGCPDCGGPIWQLKGEVIHFRCHIGHAYSAGSMVHGLIKAEEQALYAALRTMEERVRMLRKLETESRTHIFRDRREEAGQHAELLKGMLHTQGKDGWSCQ